jgi:hypothetical protein
MRVLAASLTLTLLTSARAALAQADDGVLPPPPPAPPGAVNDERAAAPPPTPASAPPPPPTPAPPPSLAAAGFPTETSPLELPHEDAPARPKPAKPRWYGWQILVLDGSALAAFTSPYYVLAYPAFFLGAPIAHLSHKAGAKAAISEGLRIGVPYVAGLIGARIHHCDVGNPAACAKGVHPGALVGAFVVSAFDAAVLGRRDVLETPPPSKPKSAFSFQPSARIERGGLTLTASGSF